VAAVTGSVQPPVLQIVPYYPPHIGGMENVARVLAGASPSTGTYWC